MSYMYNKDADQPAHPHSLISAFIVHSQSSVRHIVAIFEVSADEQASLSLTWTHFLENRFSHDKADIFSGS